MLLNVQFCPVTRFGAEGGEKRLGLEGKVR